MNSKYNSKAWRRKSRVIQMRDGFECQECKRRGIKDSSVQVHHINPVEDRPDLFWDDRNLISLCIECHNSMHDRGSGHLTRLGMFYREIYRRGGGRMLTQIKFVVGPPCSGKSTYVRNHIGRNDIVYDLDEIIRALTWNDLHDNNPNALDYGLQIKDLILRNLEMEDRFDTAWIIQTEMRDKDYEYYLYSPEIIRMTTTEEECLRRLKEDPDNRNVEEIKEKIKKYFSEEIPPGS